MLALSHSQNFASKNRLFTLNHEREMLDEWNLKIPKKEKNELITKHNTAQEKPELTRASSVARSNISL